MDINLDKKQRVLCLKVYKDEASKNHLYAHIENVGDGSHFIKKYSIGGTPVETSKAQPFDLPVIFPVKGEFNIIGFPAHSSEGLTSNTLYKIAELPEFLKYE